MKILTLLPVILFLSSNHLLAQSDNVRINEILLKVEHNIKGISKISYNSYCEEFNSGIQDSISKAQGKIWLAVNKKDSIFGAVFHVKGKYPQSSFDYFYDGLKSYDIRDADSTITIIDPYMYKNNANNPAKARMALIPYVALLIDTSISSTLRKNNPQASITEGDNNYNIVFKYPADELGQVTTKKIRINKKSYNILKIQNEVLWNGVSYRYSTVVDSMMINDSGIARNIPLHNTYSNYTVKIYQEQNRTQWVSDFIGSSAKNFKFPSYDHDTINLKSFRGKYVLLDFWESWCGQCIINIPEIQKLNDKYKNNLVVIGITTENRNQIENIIRKNRTTYLNIYAGKEILDDYKVSNRPTYFLIDRNGIIIEHTLGNLDAISLLLKKKL